MTVDGRGQVAELMTRAGIPADRVAAVTALAGGTYNALHAVDLTDGARLVLKVPPPHRLPRLRYEAGLLLGEARFYASAADAGVPAPRVLRAEPDEGTGHRPYLLMTHCPGRPWHEIDSASGTEEGGTGEAGGGGAAGPGIGPDEHRRLRRELGGLVARLHTVHGPAFGYPAEGTGPLTASWPAAFTAMAGALLEDAEQYAPWLPVDPARLRAVFAAAEPALAQVTAPALVHFDLWPGNILLDGAPGARTVGALIDGERMFWGDPLADFASLGLTHTAPEEDPDFLAGYAAAGGVTRWDAAARRRIALYRAYLYLIMLVEVVPRGYDGEHLAWVREFAGPRLAAAVAAAG